MTFHESPFLDKFEKKDHVKPKVSIILPARNEEKFIDKCLVSLLNQDYDNYEIIAINDSSEDSTGDLIKKYAKKYSKIVAIQGDPIRSINRKTDTTLLLALEAQRRGYKIYYYETKNLTFLNNKVYALCQEIEFT